MTHKIVALFLLFTGLVVVTGCGPSQSDLMARAMQRSRGPDDDDDDNKAGADDDYDEDYVAPEPRPVAAKKSAPSKAAAKPGAGKPEASEVAEVETEEASEAIAGILPVAQRVPEEPLTEQERRSRAVDNLTKVSEAILAYVERKKRFPPLSLKTPGDIPALSWRVAILPDLGYGDLYNQFDRRKRWNQEPNKSLLQYIPKEYISPERFDTKTNYLAPVGPTFAFREGKPIKMNDIEDGLDNIIFLLEANDEMAVEWTQPGDYLPDIRGGLDHVKDGLNGLRDEGTFAVWGTGYPVLLASTLSPQYLFQSFTIDGGEIKLAGKIHRDIPVKKASPAALASVTEIKPVVETVAARPEREIAPQYSVVANRPIVPPALDVGQAKDRLGDIYRERLLEAEEPTDNDRLAGELIKTSLTLESDPPGMYAMQRLALDTAIKGERVQTVLNAVDALVVSFNVDAYELNRDALFRYAKQIAPSKAKGADERRYTQRAIRTAAAAVNDNDFGSAMELARSIIRISDDKRTDTIPQLLGQFAGTLRTAESNFSTVKDSLATYRNDPDDDEAASVVGRYLCFIKGDWESGLPLLTRGGAPSLRVMAQVDLDGASDNARALSIGDEWWDLGKRASSKVYRAGAIDRAMIWYRQAFESLPQSLDRMHAKVRLDEGQDLVGSPLALLRRLADETKVNLEIPLAAVKVSAALGDDDDDDD